MPAGKDTHVFKWRGTEANSLLAFTLVSAGLDCAVHDVGVTAIETTPEEAAAIVRQVADNPPDVNSISEFVENLQAVKFDEMVPESLLRRLWARAHEGMGNDLGAMARKLLA